ncbi:MAG: dihydroneopterin aldolase [Duncaniella sp.]|nr:dihydroneopterin aldolase [Duncaniella sp.]
MTGTVEINGLRLTAHHGVLPQERTVGNLFEVTVHLRYPMEGAMRHDDLSETLNYAEAVEIIRSEMETPSQLLENVVGRIREALLARFPRIEGGMIRLAKLTPPIPAEMVDVAVRVEW